MTPADFSRAVLRAVRGAVAAGELSVTVPERVVVRAPMPGEGGGGETDLACNIALKIAKDAGRPPREVAEVLRRRLVGVPGIAGVEIAGAGFLNVTLTGPARAALVWSVRERGEMGERGERGESPAPGAGGTAVALRAARGVRAAVVVEALGRILLAGGVEGRGGAEVGEPRVEVIRPRPVEVSFEGGSSYAGVVGTASEEDSSYAGVVGTAFEGGFSYVGIVGTAEAAGVPEASAAADASAAAPREWRALTARLGPDEARWVLLRAAQHDVVRLPEKPVQRESNGRFRVQYAYARTCAMTRNARELGFAAEPGDVGGVAGGWGVREVREVWAALAEYPGVVEAAARHRAPDRVARHLEVTADAWLRCHDVCPPLPVGEEKPSAVHRARLALAEAVGTVLANGLHLLGISTPERL
ncbi:ArgS-related anticodon-binding protein NrtL [Streptomyces sp. NPDC045369]|uniref:ArgS-related anticodon-binding protein NrtL n=1 Tax=Streptomyces sp. NPDC045369 TaxID=3155732 RepID=UPI0033D2D024